MSGAAANVPAKKRKITVAAMFGARALPICPLPVRLTDMLVERSVTDLEKGVDAQTDQEARATSKHLRRWGPNDGSNDVPAQEKRRGQGRDDLTNAKFLCNGANCTGRRRRRERRLKSQHRAEHDAAPFLHALF